MMSPQSSNHNPSARISTESPDEFSAAETSIGTTRRERRWQVKKRLCTHISGGGRREAGGEEERVGTYDNAPELYNTGHVRVHTKLILCETCTKIAVIFQPNAFRNNFFFPH
jgi:hypothetical protein